MVIFLGYDDLDEIKCVFLELVFGNIFLVIFILYNVGISGLILVSCYI